MSDFFKEFQKISKLEWEKKIHAELKGNDPSLLEIDDPIEELHFKCYYHQDDSIVTNDLPGTFPFTRGMNSPNNTWNNGALILIDDEVQANKKALKSLNSGADLLVFKAEKDDVNWKVVLNEIQFEYIETQFVVNAKKDIEYILELIPESVSTVHFNLDFLDNNSDLNDFESIARKFKLHSQRFCSVNGFKLQQAGATTWQEIAFCLNTAHEYLLKLMGSGFTIDEASAAIGFKIGIGSNYFYETAKLRALKQLWSKIIHEYSPEHGCTYNCHITAVIGHSNKSLIDPHTNLLRQSTEAMSAINAGIDGIVILPYDLHSKNGASELAERMALNISTILKEESYLDMVIDPVGGSYSLEKLTELIGQKAWTAFQQLEKDGGVFNPKAIESFMNQIRIKRGMRIESFRKGETVGIGINTFEDPKAMPAEWKQMDEYLGMKPLILESEYKTTIV